MPPITTSLGRALRVLPFFLLAFILVALGPMPAQAQEQPRLLQQNYDDDCGLAALRMLLERAGIKAGDRELLAGLDPNSGENALTASDLVAMVDSLKLEVRLEVGFLPLPMVSQLAEREPFLILLKPQYLPGRVGVIGHFVLIERSYEDGFVVADPVLPERVRMSSSLFAASAHGKAIGEQPHAMVLRLTRGARGAAMPVPPQSQYTKLGRWEQAYQLPQVLPKGKTTISVSHFRQGESVIDPDQGLAIRGNTDVTVIDLSRGIGGRTQVGLSLLRASGTGEFRLPGEVISVGRAGSIGAILRIDHIPRVTLPHSMGLSTSASVEWGRGIAPDAATISGDLDWSGSHLEAGIGGELRFDGALIGLITPTVGFRLPTRSGFMFSGAFSAPYKIGASRPEFELQASVHKQLGSDLQVGVFASAGIFQRTGASSHQLGLSLTYGIPRHFRRAKTTRSF